MTDTIIAKKPCSACHKDLPLDCFHKDKAQRTGYRTSCKACSSKRQKINRSNVPKRTPVPASKVRINTEVNDDELRRRSTGKTGDPKNPFPTRDPIATNNLTDEQIKAQAKATAIKKVLDNHWNEFIATYNREARALKIERKWTSAFGE